MTKFIIGAIVVLGLALGARQFYQYWGKYKGTDTPPAAYIAPPTSGDNLPGMPSNLEAIYQASRPRGVAGLRDFLTIYGNTISDPRLAWIQLDYVVLVASSDPTDARRVFKLVKTRIQPDSPAYSRVQLLEKTYE
jgi:hypothetical protein